MFRSLSLSSAALLLIALTGCGPASKPAEPDAEAEPTATASAEASAAPESDPEPAVAKKKTKAELEAEMAPPEGVLDVRPILGTDPDAPMPAIFTNVKKGMTAKDLNADFPGLGTLKGEYATYTKRGKTWVKVTGNQAHKEVLDLKFDGQGGLEKIGYMFDPAVASDAFWAYLKKAAVARFGESADLTRDPTRDLIAFKVSGLKNVTIHKVDAKTYSFRLEL